MKQLKALGIGFWNVLEQLPPAIGGWLKNKTAVFSAWLDTDIGDGSYGKEES